MKNGIITFSEYEVTRKSFHLVVVWTFPAFEDPHVKELTIKESLNWKCLVTVYQLTQMHGPDLPRRSVLESAQGTEGLRATMGVFQQLGRDIFGVDIDEAELAIVHRSGKNSNRISVAIFPCLSYCGKTALNRFNIRSHNSLSVYVHFSMSATYRVCRSERSDNFGRKSSPTHVGKTFR